MVKRELQKYFEEWFPSLSSQEAYRVRAGFEAWVKDNYVETVSAKYAEDPEVFKTCISVLLAPLRKMEESARADYLKLYPYQEALMKTVRCVWEAARERNSEGKFLSLVEYQILQDELYAKITPLKEVMAGTACEFREHFEKLQSDVFLDLEYARGNTESMSDYMKNR